MSKPLEMPIHPRLKWPRRGVEIESYRKQWKVENALRLGKRFTDAELAAEYYAMDSLCRREQWIESVRGDDYSARELQGQTGMYDRLNTLYRFATTPSYDEAAS